MSHPHHEHGHPHRHTAGGGLSLEEKLQRLLTHWIDHNADHASTYRGWAAQADAADMAAVADRLRKAADLSEEIGRQFEAARTALP
ncbi:MAG: hypothetical protein QNJ22_19500 [Desulfosarcinaceae bacterium]|nr:hypothetical protein [Desulfosarcinaceae bacterium]